VLEVTIAMSITATILLASAAAFLSSIATVKSAERTSRGAIFAETVMEDLAAQPYANLLTFNGNRIYDDATVARAHYAVDLTVFTAAIDLIQLRAVLTDLRTGRELARMTTLRTNR
jgi:Tfp pilus assembly protein PilV